MSTCRSFRFRWSLYGQIIFRICVTGDLWTNLRCHDVYPDLPIGRFQPQSFDLSRCGWGPWENLWCNQSILGPGAFGASEFGRWKTDRSNQRNGWDPCPWLVLWCERTVAFPDWSLHRTCQRFSPAAWRSDHLGRPSDFFAHLQQMAILCSSKYYSHRVADWHFGADRKLHHGKSRVSQEFLSWILWFASACSGWSSQFGRAVSYFEPGGEDTSSRGACAAWHVGLVGHDPRLAGSATYHPFVLWWSIHLGISHKNPREWLTTSTATGCGKAEFTARDSEITAQLPVFSLQGDSFCWTLGKIVIRQGKTWGNGMENIEMCRANCWQDINGHKGP